MGRFDFFFFFFGGKIFYKKENADIDRYMNIHIYVQKKKKEKDAENVFLEEVLVLCAQRMGIYGGDDVCLSVSQNYVIGNLHISLKQMCSVFSSTSGI